MDRTLFDRPKDLVDIAATRLRLAQLDAEVEQLRAAINGRRFAGAHEGEVTRLRSLRDELATHVLAARTLLDAGAADEASRLVGRADLLRKQSARLPA